jgi:Fe2+ transport system protein FeoA
MERQCAPVGRVGSHTSKAIQLNNLNVGHSGRVVTVHGERELKRRLLEMGFCNGVRVQAIRKAPLGDPIEFRLRGYHISLRAEQAGCIRILPE